MSENKPLTVKECRAKLAECRYMAERVPKLEHRIMLRNMADAWERLCTEMERALARKRSTG